jgi:hypothetical protein
MMDDLGAFTGIMLNGRRLTSHKSQPQARARV